MSTLNSRATDLMTLLLGDPAGQSLPALAERMELPRPLVSRVAQRCSARGLLRWTRSPVDRRIILYSLTDQGRAELFRVGVR